MWSSARSPRGPLCDHAVCGPLGLQPVVLLRAHLVCGSLRARPVVLYALTLSMVLWAFNPWPSYALTSYVVLCALTPWCYTRSPRMWSSARSARAHLFHADLLHDFTFTTVCIFCFIHLCLGLGFPKRVNGLFRGGPVQASILEVVSLNIH